MKFGLTHRILTSALAALGVFAIVMSGALGRISTTLLLGGLVFAIFATERFQQSTTARYIAAIVPSTLLGVEVLRLMSGAPLLDLAVEFAAALQIVRLATRRGASHDQQVILLALLHLVAGTVLGGGVTYGLCLFGFLVLAPGALVLSHLRREVEGNYRQGARDRTGLPVDVPRILRSRRVIGPGFLALTCLLSLPILLFTALIFVAFPRVGLSLLLLNNSRAIRTTGFSDSVDLGGVGTIRSDPAIVIRFRKVHPDPNPPAKLILRLRGTAFDEYNSSGQWTRSTTERITLSRVGTDVPITRFPDPERDEVLRIELEPLDPTVLFLPSRTVAIRWAPGNEGGVPRGLARTSESTLRYDGSPDRVMRYDAYVSTSNEPLEEPLSDVDRVRYLQLPKDLPERTVELARKWTEGAKTDAEKAARVLDELSRYRYTLDAPSGGKANPIDDFLFSTHAGHCEFFSTAHAILLRTVGVPTRNVSGFVGGTYNRWGNFYAVRQGDAHSWVEVYLQGRGWVTFDPTPSSGARPLADGGGVWGFMRDIVEAISQGWDRWVVGYDLPTQLQLFQRIGQGLSRAKQQITSDRGKADTKVRWIALGVVGGCLLLLGVGYYFWRRKPAKAETDPDKIERDRRNKVVTDLWLDVEEALQSLGTPRPRHIPPLRFAEQLAASQREAHVTDKADKAEPTVNNITYGQTVLMLARRYMQARFGGVMLDENERVVFEEETRKLWVMGKSRSV